MFSSKRTSNEQNDQDGTSNRKKSTCVTLIIKPLRIFQFLVVLLIFVFVIYTIALKNSEISTLSCIILIVLSGVYVFVLAVDLISQFSGGELHAIPMFLFSLLGILLFGAAGILLAGSYSATGMWYILVICILSLLITLLFLIEVMMVLAFWKRRCDQCKRCCQTDLPQILQEKGEHCHPLCPETIRHDLMTSVSSLRVPSGDENATPDHSYRKVGYGHRRQYVDCPTGVRSASAMDIVGVQTDPHVTFTIESQTQRREVKEMPVQTVSKCELCQRQIQLNTISTTKLPSTQPQSPSQCPCPAFVQLLRGAQCCTGCVAGIVQVQQQTQKEPPPSDDQPDQQKNGKQMQWTQGTDKNSYGVMTSEKSPMGQVATSGVNLKSDM